MVKDMSETKKDYCALTVDFKLDDYHHDIPDEDLLSDIKKVSEELDKNTLTQSEYRQAGGKYSPDTIRHRFGSWIAVLEKCNLNVNVYQIAAAKSSHKHQNVSAEDVIKDVKRVANSLGKKTISSTEYKKIGEFSLKTCFKRYNSWQEILSIAGLEPFIRKSKRRLNDEDMLKEIEEIWIKLGRQPTSSDIKNGNSRYSLHAYAEHFGGWRGALNTFIEWINEREDTNLENNETIDYKIQNDEMRKIKKEITKEGLMPSKTCAHKTSRNINLRLRFKVMQRDNFSCVMCGASPAKDQGVKLHIDHIVPWSKGGETEYSNLQTLCSNCNIGKSDLDLKVES